jgi:CCR4-NOT complex subunit CAF16
VQVLLMDEITVDMDVLGRMDLLDFFRQECEQRGATIVYATHIFDGLEGWITHVAYLEDGGLVHGEATQTVSVTAVQQTMYMANFSGWTFP